MSLTRLRNRALRAGLQAGGARRRKRPIYREEVHSLGTPRIALDKVLALSYDAVLVSCDADFARFKGLRWENPLQSCSVPSR